ncbi:ATP-binding protein [Actinomadura sp. KC216]|uniref:sensor histidine kinase n=1 Tax=Actinomadura sp. KC216 TaxID=2530370 RepID=UPI0014050B40|nr:ATP-binding protein [Actinomadura sp. KC216]
MAVAAQRMDVIPIAGRLVVLLPSPHNPGELLWHWPRLYRGHEHTGACWFQPFSQADAYDDTADRISAVIDAKVRRRRDASELQAPIGRPNGEVGERLVLDVIGRPLHKLVYRQLMVLDATQKGVEDPALLRRLYEIDHLAMRTLRGLERIAVLGGVRPRELPEPLPLATVLRMAASQVEYYSRVRIPPPGVEVELPRDAATEITLLLAELIENATRFSPPDTEVLVTVVPTSSAGLSIKIADRGLPVAQHERAALNRLLTEPDSADLREQIVDGPIGLMVVGRLAERHGVRVVLHPRSGGGTRAVVEVPEALLPEPQLPPVAAAPAAARVVADVSNAAVEAVTEPTLAPLTGSAPTAAVEPVEAAEALLHRADLASRSGRMSAPETEPSAEPDGGLPPLPRRAGAHRRAGALQATGGSDTTNEPASSTATGAGADAGAAAAFLQGAHDPADRADGHASGKPPLLDTSSDPPPDPATN